MGDPICLHFMYCIVHFYGNLQQCHIHVDTETLCLDAFYTLLLTSLCFFILIIFPTQFQNIKMLLVPEFKNLRIHSLLYSYYSSICLQSKGKVNVNYLNYRNFLIQYLLYMFKETKYMNNKSLSTIERRRHSFSDITETFFHDASYVLSFVLRYFGDYHACLHNHGANFNQIWYKKSVG